MRKDGTSLKDTLTQTEKLQAEITPCTKSWSGDAEFGSSDITRTYAFLTDAWDFDLCAVYGGGSSKELNLLVNGFALGYRDL